MAGLKYKTRGNSSPQGKPRVYFCCHFEDFDKYFESVSDEILAKQNCAIWYGDKNVVRDEDFFADLKQMQLFVMPVTTNLLCTENEALDIEFKFAIENHIPVLPLIQESGLEELFNKKCGDLQFLDKNNTDATAISYDEKLKKYLESVLIGDELAEKIRAAFDAYVFLSYRKKDRKYAQELMRLIHKNDFCRDIAIWYDEFLTPGENFNDSIKEALQKSGLFVLTVTPNLVNEPNYIMTTEYPMAKQDGKPILPAELVPTDREQLSEKYEDIPNPANAHNEAELSEALLESIKKMAIKENNNSPEHSFFIGLAYLGGIDVEVDTEKAVLLITFAAEAEITEAMKKLSDMYFFGEGVPRNIEISKLWNRKLIKVLQKQFDDKRTVENGQSLFFPIKDYIERTSEIERYKDDFCKEICQQLCRLGIYLFNSNPNYTNKYNLAYAYSKSFGHINWAFNRTYILMDQLFAEAEDIESIVGAILNIYDKYDWMPQEELNALQEEILKRIQNENLTIDNYAEMNIKLSSISRVKGDLQTAEKYLELAQDTVFNHIDVCVRILPLLFEEMGCVQKEHGEYLKEEEYFKKAYEHQEQAFNIDPCVQNCLKCIVLFNRWVISCFKCNCGLNINTFKDVNSKFINIIPPCHTFEIKIAKLLFEIRLADFSKALGEEQKWKEAVINAYELAIQLFDDDPQSIIEKSLCCLVYLKYTDYLLIEFHLDAARKIVGKATRWCCNIKNILPENICINKYFALCMFKFCEFSDFDSTAICELKELTINRFEQKRALVSVLSAFVGLRYKLRYNRPFCELYIETMSDTKACSVFVV